MTTTTKSATTIAVGLVKFGFVVISWRYILCVSKIFAAIRFVDAYGTKKPYQNSMSLCRREN